MDSAERKPASDITRAANAAVGHTLSLDPADAGRATRGLIAQHPTGQITGEWGNVVWDTSIYEFLDETDVAPPSVNPSLWRQARLNNAHGLFEIMPGVWQVRGYDISNITFLAGTDGWVVIDPLTAAETAAAALELANEHLGARPVTAVIYTHSHVDHFGGVLGVVDPADVDAGKVRIIAPEGFLAETVSENVVAGPAMLRRASYMYGVLLPTSELGQIDCGLGKTTAMGSVGLIAPTEEIRETGTELVVDGIRIVFQNTPGTEAPAEMNFHFPDLRLLCMAENCSHNMHNLYTPRGAQVRDALNWSKYIHESIELFGDQTDICFASHHWPRFGHDDAIGFLEQQRDVYRWLHDQTMRLANHGFTPIEIAEQLDLPDVLAGEGHTRGYYGTVSHNVKAVYQRYLGWFDGNPANLHPLPPEDAAVRYVEYMGGADAVLERAQVAFADGEYRWVAQVVNHLVFADPANTAARNLQADALEQLGYQAESGPWRNFYLTGAQELRHGPPAFGAGGTVTAPGLVGAMTIAQVFDAIGVRLDTAPLGSRRLAVNWHFTDTGERHVLGLCNGALHHSPGRSATDPDASVTLARSALDAVLAGASTLADLVGSGDISVDGDADSLLTLLGNLDQFDRGFPIVTP